MSEVIILAIIEPDKEFRDNLRRQMNEKVSDDLLKQIKYSIYKHYYGIELKFKEDKN